MTDQPEFQFDAPGATVDGVSLWQRQRAETARRLALRLGLPLGREVEVWLQNGMRLRGRLELRREWLVEEAVDAHTVELIVGAVNFRHADMESCVRLD